jgi:hypothetical protein
VLTLVHGWTRAAALSWGMAGATPPRQCFVAETPRNCGNSAEEHHARCSTKAHGSDPTSRTSSASFSSASAALVEQICGQPRPRILGGCARRSTASTNTQHSSLPSVVLNSPSLPRCRRHSLPSPKSRGGSSDRHPLATQCGGQRCSSSPNAPQSAPLRVQGDSPQLLIPNHQALDWSPGRPRPRGGSKTQSDQYRFATPAWAISPSVVPGRSRSHAVGSTVSSAFQ